MQLLKLFSFLLKDKQKRSLAPFTLSHYTKSLYKTSNILTNLHTYILY